MIDQRLLRPGSRSMHHADAPSRWWQRLNGWAPAPAPDHRMAVMRLHCSSCARVHHIALRKDGVLRDLLAVMSCPTCREVGTMSVVRDEVA